MHSEEREIVKRRWEEIKRDESEIKWRTSWDFPLFSSPRTSWNRFELVFALKWKKDRQENGCLTIVIFVDEDEE